MSFEHESHELNESRAHLVGAGKSPTDSTDRHRYFVCSTNVGSNTERTELTEMHLYGAWSINRM